MAPPRRPALVLAAAVALQARPMNPARAAGETFDLPGQRAFSRCHRLPGGTPRLRLNLPPNADLEALAAWMSAVGCATIVVPGPLLKKKKVTVFAPGNLALTDAYRLFFGALEAHGLTVEPQGKTLRIVESGRARSRGLPVITAEEERGTPDERHVTRLFRFQYLDPTAVVSELFKHLRGEKGVALAFGGTIVATDRATMLERFGEIVRELDRPEVARERLWLVRVKRGSARAMAARLAQIFQVRQPTQRPGQRLVPRPAPARPAKSPPPSPRKAAHRLDELLTIEKLIADDRSGRLIVVAREPAHELLRAIMSRLELTPDPAEHDLVHLYPCEYAECLQLAATLSAITGVPLLSTGSPSRTGSPRARRSPVRASRPRGRSAPSPAPAERELFGRGVRLAVDAGTNTLLVVSTRPDFEALRRLVARLDVPRKQVYIEALVLEVLLDRNQELGVAYHAGRSVDLVGARAVALGGFEPGTTLNPAGLAGDLVGLAGALFGPALDAAASRLVGVALDIPSFGAFVQALQRDDDIKVLSSPNLLITSNQEGEISVGQRLPFPSGFLSGSPPAVGVPSGLLPQVSVQREDVSLRMKLAPRVTERDQVRLNVDVEISDLAAANFNGLGPATSRRSARTEVICHDQQTVVIGGLMADRTTDTSTKVPLLGDLPVVGLLFRRSSKQVQKSNLIIALTPHVISEVGDLRRVAERKMRERRELVERFSSRPESVWSAISRGLEIDYRDRRGMLEQINRAAREIDEEDADLRRFRLERQQEAVPVGPGSS